MIAWPSASVAVAASCVVNGTTPAAGVADPTLMVGARLAWIEMPAIDAVPVPPLPSDTVTVAVNVPAAR